MVSINDDNVCPYCRDCGKCNRLIIVQSTWKSAIIICSDPSCIYPLDKSLCSVERDWSQLGRERKDTDKDLLAKVVEDMRIESDKDNQESPSNEEKNITQLPITSIENDQVSTVEPVEFNSKDSFVADDGELNDLLDYLSNLPNNAFTAFSELPTSTSLDILNQQNEILKVITLPVIILPDNGLGRPSMPFDHRDHLASSEGIQRSNGWGASLEKVCRRHYPQWPEEEKNLSWLTAGMALVVHSRLIRNVLKSSMQGLSSGFPDDASDKDCVTALCTMYEMIMQRFLVGVTLCNKENTDKDIGANQSSGDSASGYETSSGNFITKDHVVTFGEASNSFRIPRSIHERIICHLSACKDLVRQTMITSKVLANHPADVLAFLLNSNDTLKDLSIVSYRTTVNCTECGQRSVSFQASRAVTLELPTSLQNFSMIGPQCCATMSCGLCGVANQVALIEWQTLSPLLFLHFPVGLPEHCNFEKLQLDLDSVNVSKENILGVQRYCITSRGKYELRVSAVVAAAFPQDASKGAQYITWVRRGNDFWMPCREAHGPGSHMTEWDPHTSPRVPSVRHCDVRILLFEAQACPSSINNNTLHKSASAGFLDLRRPPSMLHQRYVSIMRQRRKELHAAASVASPSPVVSVPAFVDSAASNDKNMLQRFLQSEQDHKGMLDGTRLRFEPYSAEVKSPPSSKSEPNSSLKRRIKSEIHVFPGLNSYAPKSKIGSSSVGKSRKKSCSGKEISAISLWPAKKQPRLSDAQMESTQVSSKAFPSVVEESCAVSLFEGLSAKDPEPSQ